MTDTTAMLPCPHCGAAPELAWTETHGGFVHCPNADCYNHNSAKHDREATIAAWNRRAALAGQADAEPVAWRAVAISENGRSPQTTWIAMPVGGWALADEAMGVCAIEYAYTTQPAAIPVDALRELIDATKQALELNTTFGGKLRLGAAYDALIAGATP